MRPQRKRNRNRRPHGRELRGVCAESTGRLLPSVHEPSTPYAEPEVLTLFPSDGQLASATMGTCRACGDLTVIPEFTDGCCFGCMTEGFAETEATSAPLRFTPWEEDETDEVSEIFREAQSIVSMGRVVAEFASDLRPGFAHMRITRPFAIARASERGTCDCGVSFDRNTIGNPRRYCSLVCKWRAIAKRAQRAILPAACALCTREFLPARGTMHVFCSDRCKGAARVARRAKARAKLRAISIASHRDVWRALDLRKLWVNGPGKRPSKRTPYNRKAIGPLAKELLRLVETNPGTSGYRLAKAMGCTEKTARGIYTSVHRLELRGLLKRTPSGLFIPGVRSVRAVETEPKL